MVRISDGVGYFIFLGCGIFKYDARVVSLSVSAVLVDHFGVVVDILDDGLERGIFEDGVSLI